MMVTLMFDAPFVLASIELALERSKLLDRQMVLVCYEIDTNEDLNHADLIYSFGDTLRYYKVFQNGLNLIVHDLILKQKLLNVAVNEFNVYRLGKGSYEINKLNKRLSNALSFKTDMILGCHPNNRHILKEYSDMYVMNPE